MLDIVTSLDHYLAIALARYKQYGVLLLHLRTNEINKLRRQVFKNSFFCLRKPTEKELNLLRDKGCTYLEEKMWIIDNE